jgi:O-antigen/teichoic acid export membrane protein
VTRSYWSGLASNYLNQLTSVVINLILIPYLLRRVGSQLTGVYLVLMTVANFVAVGIGWLATAGVRSIATLSPTTDRESICRVHRLIVLAFAAYSMVIVIVMIGAGSLVGSWWLVGASLETIAQARYATLILGAYIWISYVHNADLALLAGLLRQGEANLYRSAAQILFGLTAVVLLICMPRIDLLLLAQLLATIVVAAGVRIGLRRRRIISPWEWALPDGIVARQVLLTTGGSYFLFGVAQFVLLYSDVFLIGAVLGTEAVTAYVVVWKMAEFGGLLLSRISETLSPYLSRIEARGSIADLRIVFLATSRLQLALAVGAGLGYAMIGPSLVALWVGPANRPSIWWLYPLCGAALIFQVVNRHDVILHFAMGRVGKLIVPHIVEVTAKIGLTVVLLPQFGIGAPLIAYVAVQLLGLTWWYRGAALKLARITWRQWWSEVASTGSLELGLVVACALAIGPEAMSWSWKMTIVSGVLLTALLSLLILWHWRRVSSASLTNVVGLLSKH